MYGVQLPLDSEGYYMSSVYSGTYCGQTNGILLYTQLQAQSSGGFLKTFLWNTRTLISKKVMEAVGDVQTVCKEVGNTLECSDLGLPLLLMYTYEQDIMSRPACALFPRQEPCQLLGYTRGRLLFN